MPEIHAIQFLEAMPKVELHLHLEGAIPLDALWTLVEKYGPEDSGVGSYAELERRFAYRDFPHFLATWGWKNGFLREYEDFTFIAERVAAHLASQQIRYVEAFYSPGDFARHGLEVAPLTAAIRRGLDVHAADVEIKLVADLIRDFGPERGGRWLDELAEVRDMGVLGIGIGGSEHAFPPEPYSEVYARARRLGFRTSAHAGEAAGPGSVWGALRALEVDRIGHGTHAIADPSLIDHLRETQIPLELCPLSNVRTGVVAELAAHPVKAYLDAGVLVSLNTDDPAMFHTRLATEYAMVMETFGLSWHDVHRLAANAIASAWCSPDRKAELRSELDSAFASCRADGLSQAVPMPAEREFPPRSWPEFHSG